MRSRLAELIAEQLQREGEPREAIEAAMLAIKLVERVESHLDRIATALEFRNK
jgi:hypothetical protein